MFFFFFPCGRFCSQGLIKVPQHHHGDWWWSGMLSNPSTAVSHLLFYPQSSSTPPSIFHSADALLLIPSSSKKKNSTRDFPHAPITSPPPFFPVSLVAFSQCLLSVSPFFTFLNISFLCSDLDSPSISWWCLHQFFIADFPSKLLYITHLPGVSLRGTSNHTPPDESWFSPQKLLSFPAL